MKCIFLDDKNCTLQLPQTLKLHTWTVDGETEKNLCEAGAFLTCPRLKAYMEFLEKMHK
jgi:hypothetical protein